MSSINCGKVTQNNPTYEWSIKEFSSRCKTFGNYILSPKFSVANEFSWQLRIYPYGVEEKDDGYLSLYLISNNNNCNVKAVYQLTIIGIRNFGKLEYIFKPNSSISGYRNFAKRDDITKELIQLKRGIIIKCEFHNITKIQNSCDSLINTSKFAVLNDIATLLMNKEFHDITIKTNTKEIRAHKLILSARSKVFAAMFKHEMIEKKTNIVEIKDIDCEVVELMLKFIYTGEVGNFEKVKELLVAADKYRIDLLKNICIAKLEQTMDVDNAVNLLLFAKLHNLNEFEKSILDFMGANVKDIIRKPDFDLLKDMPDILFELLRKQALN